MACGCANKGNKTPPELWVLTASNGQKTVHRTREEAEARLRRLGGKGRIAKKA